MRAFHRMLATALLAALPLSGTASAQDGRAATLQAEARQKFQELHERMQKLQVLKAKTDPEEGDLLARGNRFVQERALHAAMRDVHDLIVAGQYDEALQDMAALQTDLERLLDLLLNRDLDLERLLEEIERLEKYRERVEELIAEQHAEKQDAVRSEALEKHLKALEQARQDVEELLREQRELRETANQAGLEAPPAEAEAMAQQEGELKRDAEALAERLGEIEKTAEELQREPADGAPQPGAEEADAPEKGASQDGEPGDGQPKDGQPKDGQPKAGQPKDPSGGKSGGSGSCSGSCQGAAGAMGEARNKLQANTPERSLEDMDRAIRELEKTLQELERMSEEARRQLLQLPFDQQVRAQEVTRVDTDRLAQDMEADDAAGDSQGNPRKTPGKQNIQQAVPKQKAAAGQLKDYKPGKASQEQQDALDELEKARQALEDALAQLRQELQDEVLRALEERFAAMLEKQKELSARTKAVDRLVENTMVAADTVPAAIARRCGEIGAGEFELAGEASDALKLLVEEGTTAVFPAVVELLRDDLTAVGERLTGNDSGRTTQEMQAAIEEMLRDLLDALRRQIEMNEGNGQCGQCNGQPPLVPMSAELRLVMIKQKRVNQRTVAYDRDVPRERRSTDAATDAAQELSRQQGQVEDLLRRLAVKLNKESEAGN